MRAWALPNVARLINDPPPDHLLTPLLASAVILDVFICLRGLHRRRFCCLGSWRPRLSVFPLLLLDVLDSEAAHPSAQDALCSWLPRKHHLAAFGPLLHCRGNLVASLIVLHDISFVEQRTRWQSQLFGGEPLTAQITGQECVFQASLNTSKACEFRKMSSLWLKN